MEPVAVSTADAFAWGFHLLSTTFPVVAILAGIVVGAAVILWASDYV